MLRMDRRGFLLQTAASGLALRASWRRALAQTAPDDAQPPPADVIQPRTQKAIKNGLSYLAARQNPDGSFGEGQYRGNVAVCSLCGMAFMAAGSTPGRGKYGQAVSRTVRFILSQTQESGFIQAPEWTSRGPMYGHGFATLFLAEAYGMWPDSEVREKLSAAVKLIINTQNSEGGWRYFPAPVEADISVTVCQVMALRAARNAGIDVPSKTIDRCIAYVRQSQNEDGGFMYMLRSGGPSRLPRSAAGVVALHSAGLYEGEELRKGVEYLMQHLPDKKAVASENHYFYGQYYAAQAMWLVGDRYWRKWRPAIRDVLLDRQRADGSWYVDISAEYGTAMACLILQMPNSHLTIFQR
jgi:prenyltransferase beta subunit